MLLKRIKLNSKHYYSFGLRPTRALRAPASQATTWAWARILSSRLGRKAAWPSLGIDLDRTDLQSSRPIKNQDRPLPMKTLTHFSSPLSFSAPQPSERSGVAVAAHGYQRKGGGAAAGPLASSRIRPRVSAPPSSGLTTVL